MQHMVTFITEKTFYMVKEATHSTFTFFKACTVGCTYGLVFSTVFLSFSTSLSLIFKFSGSVPKSSRSPIPEA